MITTQQLKSTLKIFLKVLCQGVGGKEGFELEASISLGAVPNQPATSQGKKWGKGFRPCIGKDTL